MIVGARIEERLAKKGWSQAELARRVGVKSTSIWKLVSGQSHGSKHLHKIAKELETTPQYLAGETDDPDADAVSLAYSSDELQLLDLLRDLTVEQRRALFVFVRAMKDGAGTPPPAPTVHENVTNFWVEHKRRGR